MCHQGTSGMPRKPASAPACADEAPAGSAAGSAEKTVATTCRVTLYGLELLIEIIQQMNQRVPVDRNR